MWIIGSRGAAGFLPLVFSEGGTSLLVDSSKKQENLDLYFDPSVFFILDTHEHVGN